MSKGRKHARHVSFRDDDEDKKAVPPDEGTGAGEKSRSSTPAAAPASTPVKHTPPRKSAAERKMDALLGARGQKDSTPQGLRKTLKRLTLQQGAHILKPGTMSAMVAAKTGATGVPMPSVEDLLQELDNLYGQLIKKDEDLKIAGTIGQALLERNEEAASRIAELERAAELHDKEAEQLKALQRQEERKCKRYQNLLHEHEKRYEDMVEDNKRLRELWEQEKAKSQRDAASLNTAEEAAETRVGQLKQTITELNTRITRLQEENGVLVQSLKRDQEKLFSATEELEEARRLLAQSRAETAAALARIPTQEDSSTEELDRMQEVNKQLTGSLKELQATVDRMREKQEEDARQLAAAKDKIETLQAALANKQVGDEQSWSLADDMKDGDTSSSSSPAPPASSRPRVHSGYVPTTVSSHRASVHRSSKSISGGLLAQAAAAATSASGNGASASTAPSHSRAPSLSINTTDISVPVQNDVSTSVQSAKDRLAALKKRVEAAKAQRNTARRS